MGFNCWSQPPITVPYFFPKYDTIQAADVRMKWVRFVRMKWVMLCLSHHYNYAHETYLSFDHINVTVVR